MSIRITQQEGAGIEVGMYINLIKKLEDEQKQRLEITVCELILD